MRYRPRKDVLALGDGFFDEVVAARFPKHVLRHRNARAAESVGLGSLDEAAWEAAFAKFSPLEDNLTRPLALRYHGHQFGVYNPRLGDGRGFLFAQLEDARGRLLDLGTKGSGQTPYSRGGDGRLTLQGGVREVLATTMLEALGVDTSKSFSLFETGEALYRGDEPSPTRSSVLVRLSHSHVRFGTFQRLSYAGDAARMKKLVDYVVTHFYPELASEADVLPKLLEAITLRHARTTARWMVAGFVHGVLNSDNMNVTGESFDYGPWRFLPRYELDFTAAYFDEGGLYAYGKQPGAVLWNLMRMGDALRTIDPGLAMGPALAGFQEAFVREVQAALLFRLGLASAGPEHDDALVGEVFSFLDATKMPFDRFFFDWFGGEASERRALEGPNRSAYESPYFQPLRALLEHFAPCDAARLSHPYFARPSPVTLVKDEVVRVWSAIDVADDWGPFDAHLAEIRSLGDALAT